MIIIPPDRAIMASSAPMPLLVPVSAVSARSGESALPSAVTSDADVPSAGFSASSSALSSSTIASTVSCVAYGSSLMVFALVRIAFSASTSASSYRLRSSAAARASASFSAVLSARSCRLKDNYTENRLLLLTHCSKSVHFRDEKDAPSKKRLLLNIRYLQGVRGKASCR